MQTLINQLAMKYQREGYTVSVMPLGAGVTISFNKGSGIQTVLGMCEGIKANIFAANGLLNVSFTDAQWTDKIIALCIGWIVCTIPWITGIIGLIAQLDLPKKIGNDIQILLAGPQGAWNPGQNPPPAQ